MITVKPCMWVHLFFIFSKTIDPHISNWEISGPELKKFVECCSKWCVFMLVVKVFQPRIKNKNLIPLYDAYSRWI